MYDPSCSLKTYNDFLCESPQNEESFLNEKHPCNNAEQPAQTMSLVIRVCQVPKWVWCTIQQAFAYVKKDNRLLWEKRLRPKSEYDYKSAVKGMHTTR